MAGWAGRQNEAAVLPDQLSVQLIQRWKRKWPAKAKSRKSEEEVDEGAMPSDKASPPHSGHVAIVATASPHAVHRLRRRGDDAGRRAIAFEARPCFTPKLDRSLKDLRGFIFLAARNQGEDASLTWFPAFPPAVL